VRDRRRGTNRTSSDLIAPVCQGGLETTSAIGDHAPVDDLRELALEASQGLGGGLVLGEETDVVGKGADPLEEQSSFIVPPLESGVICQPERADHEGALVTGQTVLG
jgi:hypothetical protein